ncbi:MAG: AprI/Inh family metalloprotease inhibitor [Beijerinckiaceae bacterium]
MKLALILVAAAFTAGGAAAQGRIAPPPLSEDALPIGSDATRTIAGQWDIAVPRNNLKCRIQLNITGRPQVATIGMPAPCRKSFGAIGNAQYWELTGKGTIRLIAQKGERLVEFARADAGVLKATVGSNDFTFEPMSGRYPSPERIAGIDAAVSRLTQPQAESPETPSAVAGRYRLLRANNADTGCVLLLDRGLPGNIPKSGKASLETGCKDQGLITFDPAGWIVERDRMFLYARKGHRTGFNIERNGQLVKDPPAGSPLSANKVP